MCFGAPKPPKVVEDPALKRQIEAAAMMERDNRARNKKDRFEEQLALLSGGFGRRSLITGSRGGMGYDTGMSRSLFTALR